MSTKRLFVGAKVQ